MAFYLDSVNSRKIVEEKVHASIESLKLELNENKEAILNDPSEDLMYECLLDIDSIAGGIDESLKMSVAEMHKLMEKYPKIVFASDSVRISDSLYEYTPQYDFNISVTGLQSITWEAAQINGVVNSFDYELLKALVQLYEAQETFAAAKNDLFQSLTIHDNKRIFASANVILQVKPQLVNTIDMTLEELEK